MLHTCHIPATVGLIPVSLVQSNVDYLIPSDPIPHEWRSRFVDGRGHSDSVAIVLLGQLLGWMRHYIRKPDDPTYHRNERMPHMVDGELMTSYGYLSEKLGYSNVMLRRAFIRLETHGVLKRNIRNIDTGTNERINRLCVRLDDGFFSSCFRNPETDIRIAKMAAMSGENRSRHQCRDHIISNKKNTDKRSTRSDSGNSMPEPVRTLSEFHPLSEKDCSTLRQKSCREFNQNAINEILKDMGRKLPAHSFRTHGSFMNYMGKALAHEMRDPVRINNDAFRIMPPEERRQENYLQKVEEGTDWFRRQLAASFPRERAYAILTSYRYDTRNGSTVTMHFGKHIDLTQNERHVLLEMLCARYAVLTLEGMEGITTLETLMPTPVYGNEGNATHGRKGIWATVHDVLMEQGAAASWLGSVTVTVDEEAKTAIITGSRFVIRKLQEETMAATLETYAAKIVEMFARYGYKSRLVE